MRSFYRSKAKGFTLVEIMIVVAIIALLAAIAIPNMLRSRMNANESSAKAAMKTIITACESFRAAQAPPVYPANLLALSGAVPPYVDSVLGAGAKSGYNYVLTGAANSYTVTGAPQAVNLTGFNYFFGDESGVIRQNGGVAATNTSTPIE